jgi:hypothetical protein
MTNKTQKNSLRNSTVAWAFLFASSTAWSKEGTGLPQKPDADEPPPSQPPSQEESAPKPLPPGLGPGKNKDKEESKPDEKTRKGDREIDEINIDNIKVNRSDRGKLRNCTVPRITLKKLDSSNILSLSFDPKRKSVATLEFTLSDLPEPDQEHILVLLSSRCLVNRSRLHTPGSKHKLELNPNDMAVLGSYPVPARSTGPLKVYIDLDTDTLAQNVDAGNNTFYFQAGLLKTADFDKNRCNNMILSPLEAVHVSPKSCPSRSEFSEQIKDNASCKAMSSRAKKPVCRLITE